MAKGEDIPYQLRPNKFIDRQIFLELLSKVVPHRNDGKYVYISMGSKHLVDHESVYRRIGIKNLYSIDGNADIVARQNCNKPHSRAICENLLSGALAGNLDGILANFKSAKHFVVWLDYTTRERLSQLQEYCEILKRCQPGDLVRITINAEVPIADSEWQNAGCDGPATYRAQKLKGQLGEFFPASISGVTKDEIPAALAQAVAIATSKAEAESGVTFKPVLITSYADGQRMLTIAVLAVSNQQDMVSGLIGWEFLPKDWSKIVNISAPDLSVREKVAIDKHLTKSPQAIMKAVKFQPTSELDDAQHALMSYKRLHRFYPTFYAIGIQ